MSLHRNIKTRLHVFEEEFASAIVDTMYLTENLIIRWYWGISWILGKKKVLTKTAWKLNKIKGKKYNIYILKICNLSDLHCFYSHNLYDV